MSGAQGGIGARETAMEIAPMMDIPVPNLRKECAAVLGELAVAMAFSVGRGEVARTF